MNYTLYSSLQDRVVFISGGSSGIGAELVRAFAAQGAKVAFCGTKADGGQALIDEVRRRRSAGARGTPPATCATSRPTRRCSRASAPRSARCACWSTTPAATTATRWKT